MQAAEYSNLEKIERLHWYYAGKREIVRHWINRVRPLAAQDTLLDFGAGTGCFASEFLGQCQVRVCDSYPESLTILRQRFAPESILIPDGSAIPVTGDYADCVTALDVLEHMKDDTAAVHEFHRVLRPGGIVVITVPADMKLWSDWDVSLLHYRRYDRRRLLGLFDPARWDVAHCTYTNVLAYPAVLFLRKWRRWTKASAAQGTRAEDRLPSPIVNKLLRSLYVGPAKRRWFPAPFGVSLLLIARRRA